jgi:hypothetical protein
LKGTTKAPTIGSWKHASQATSVNQHHRSLVAAAAAFPEMSQREQHQEAMDWLKKEAEKLEAVIEYRRKQLSTQPTEVTKPNPYNEHVPCLNEVYLKRTTRDSSQLS